MANPTALDMLLGGVSTQEQVKKAQEARDRAFGLSRAQLAAEGAAGLVTAPERVRDVGRLGRLLAGQDTRTPDEIKAAENKTLFDKISSAAQAKYPGDRTKQLQYLASELVANGKPVEAQRAMQAAQESELEAAKIQKETAQASEASAKAGKASAEAESESTDLGKFLGFDVKDASVESRRAAANVLNQGKRPNESDADFKKRVMAGLAQEETTPDFIKILEKAYPNQPAEKSKALKEYVDAQAKTGGGALQKEVNKAVIESNSSSVQSYKDLARGGIAEADRIDATAELAFDAIVGGGATLQTLQQGLQAIADKVGLDVDLGSLSKTAQIGRIVNNAVLLQSGLIKGALSNAELEFLRASVGDLGDTPEALRIALKRLANQKRMAVAMYGKFTGTEGTKKISEGFIPFFDLETQIRSELGLKDPAIFGASFVDSEGNIDPTAVDFVVQLYNTPGMTANAAMAQIKDRLGDFTAPAEALLFEAVRQAQSQ